jgi:putative flippase GtrA
MFLLRSEGSLQFIRFCQVGLANTAINYSIFLVMYRLLGAPYVAAAVSGFMLGAFSGFFLHRSWTFRAHESALGRGLLMYLVVQVISLGGHMASLLFCVELLGTSPELSNLFGIAVSTAINFLLSKHVVFRRCSRGLN